MSGEAPAVSSPVDGPPVTVEKTARRIPSNIFITKPFREGLLTSGGMPEKSKNPPLRSLRLWHHPGNS